MISWRFHGQNDSSWYDMSYLQSRKPRWDDINIKWSTLATRSCGLAKNSDVALKVSWIDRRTHQMTLLPLAPSTFGLPANAIHNFSPYSFFHEGFGREENICNTRLEWLAFSGATEEVLLGLLAVWLPFAAVKTMERPFTSKLSQKKREKEGSRRGTIVYGKGRGWKGPSLQNTELTANMALMTSSNLPDPLLTFLTGLVKCILISTLCNLKYFTMNISENYLHEWPFDNHSAICG